MIYLQLIKKWGAFFFAIVFFAQALLTISDYNINWDEPAHFARGQAYMRLILTGERNYDKLPKIKEFQDSIFSSGSKFESFPRYSIYQNNRDGEHFLEKDAGHPPLNGILAALSNLVFYQRFDLLGDIESYHLFIIFSSSLLVFLVFHWLQDDFGVFPAIIGTMAIITFPLFVGESHNNIKDPVEATFFAFAIYFFYRGIQKKNIVKLFLSSLFTGFAFATKLNVVFLPFIILPWLLFYFFGELHVLGIKSFLSKNKRIGIFLAVFPFIAFSILFLTWPFLWQNSINNFLKIMGYYKDIGSGSVGISDFHLYGLNLYPVIALVFTTPLFTLLLFIFGLVSMLFKLFSRKDKLFLLIALWFCVPFLRVIMPGTSIYGGIRQIMEFVPALGMIVGIGAYYLIKFFKKKAHEIKVPRRRLIILAHIVLLIGYIPIILKLISIHPNENVYFNPLIGGLKGAYERNFPWWGFALGNPYRQGVKWLNANAEKNAKVALITSTGPNIPVIFFRDDISYNNGHYSGPDKKGEYLIEAVYDGWIRVYHFAAEYANNMLIPIYEVKVDDVAILKIWKNDLEYTKEEFKKEFELDVNEISWKFDSNILSIDMNKSSRLSRIVAYYQSTCMPVVDGEVQVSLDKENWRTMPDPIREWMIQERRIVYLFAATPVKHLKVILEAQSPCVFEITKVSVMHY